MGADNFLPRVVRFLLMDRSRHGDIQSHAIAGELLGELNEYEAERSGEVDPPGKIVIPREVPNNGEVTEALAEAPTSGQEPAPPTI